MDVRNGDVKKKFAQQLQERVHQAMLKDLVCDCGSKIFRLYPLGMVKFLATDIRQTDTQPFAFSYECAGCSRWANIDDKNNKWVFRTVEEIEADEKNIAAELEAAKAKVAATTPAKPERTLTLLE